VGVRQICGSYERLANRFLSLRERLGERIR
jgi:hypothetical protein